MTLERIDFEPHEERSLKHAARWMFAAGVGHILLGLLSLEATVLGAGTAFALAIVGVTVTVAGWAIRRMATTDGRDQDHLGRAMRQLRLAIAIKLLFAGSVAIAVPVLLVAGVALTGTQLLRLAP